MNYKTGLGSAQQSVLASGVGIPSNFKLPGNAPSHIKQRGISISKSNREHKLNVEKNNISNISAIY